MNDYGNNILPPLVNPKTLNVGVLPQGSSYTRVVVISNPNQQQLLLCTDKGQTSWLTVEPNATSLEQGELQPIKVTIDTRSLDFGEQTASINFSWVGDEYSVSVELPVSLTISSTLHETRKRVAESPVAVGLSFALTPNSNQLLPLALTNQYDGIVEWQATTDSTWLLLDRNEGNLQPSEQQTINVTANAYQQDLGDYSGKVIFTQKMAGINLQNVEFNVVLHVLTLDISQMRPNAESPLELMSESITYITFSDSGPKPPKRIPLSINFASGTNKPAQLQMINQEDRGPVNWTLDTNGARWLTLDKNDGSAPGFRVNGTFQKINDSVTIHFTIDQNSSVGTSANARLILTFADPPLSSNEQTTIQIAVNITS